MRNWRNLKIKHVFLMQILPALLMVLATTCVANATDLPGLGGLSPQTTNPAPAYDAAKAAALPTSVDLTPWAMPVGNQGSVNSCVAWTIAHDMMGWYANYANSQPSLFAPMYIHSQIKIGAGNTGAYTGDGFNLAKTQGVDTESDYKQGDYDYLDLPTNAERANAANYKIADYATLFEYVVEIDAVGNVTHRSGSSGDAGAVLIKAALAASHPVAIGLPVRPGFDALFTGNSLYDDDIRGAIRGFHEVLAVGYDANGLLIQNHWGVTGPLKGFGRLSWNVVKQDIYEARTMTPLVSSVNYSDLWWVPNGSESGWGMSITQHDKTIFAAQYSYDSKGNPFWYVMSDCSLTGDRCTGDIFQVSGGTSPLAPWNGSAKKVLNVGTGTIIFSDKDNAVFNFTINGISGTKAITREIFAKGIAPPTANYTDLWWNAKESGWGVSLTQQVGTIFAVWYTYDNNGSPVWYVASNCPVSGNSCSGDLYKVRA